MIGSWFHSNVDGRSASRVKDEAGRASSSEVRRAASARRVSERIRRNVGEDARRLREDAGLSLRAVSRAIGIDHGYIGAIEDGSARASVEALARLGAALGADLALRLYPNTGPPIRDRHQARILEALLRELHPRWRRYTEVAVRSPARGWIDLVLHDATARQVVTAEIQSALPRLEQLIRWSTEKSASLPSWEGYVGLGDLGSTSTLLIARETRATREIGIQFARQLDLAYPAHPADALTALRGDRPWPGSSLIWVAVQGDAVRFSDRRAWRV